MKEEEVIRESKPAPNRLMQAILDEFAAQKIPIDLRDDEKLLVISEYQLFGTEVRQRYLAKVVRSPRGLYFKLRSMHERLDRRVNPPIWTEIEGESAAKKAYQEEQKLGLAIRDRFK